MKRRSGKDLNHGQASLIDTTARERNAIRAYFCCEALAEGLTR
jgi:hypothetical protein